MEQIFLAIKKLLESIFNTNSNQQQKSSIKDSIVINTNINPKIELQKRMENDETKK
ncbi:hypothetical protein [Listeria monocytogenes]|uniref:hypothetical protein n=1 Tax=Listeria monocytogenes TaxID=1639 RepID=UPI001356FEE1|nr:hypothetical protein [Listeria monocytogenes]EFQ8451053.1 hypothetical protein [Listeria monocytogenes]EIV7666382.1 hypothetical protein [Listeria monocytogenes]EJU1510414.1 hypothetical protein [Listeria monocytogenes]EKE9613673.1 hypothetical protein [Listeria monocytogenes]EKY8199796.1 hypothetical protein [Listeria monocytogenes]